MKLTRRTLTSALALSAALSVAGLGGVAQAADVKIALVVKSLGNGFFEAANKGAQEAAKDLGGVEIIYTGPTSTTAEGQIEVINSLIAQGVDAIAISANDPDAVVPALKKAAQRGIKVISWDSGVAPEGRILQAQPLVQRTDRQDVPAACGIASGRRQGRFRHPVSHHHLHEPEYLDRRDEKAAEGLPRPQPHHHRLR